jgi:dynein heavy chain
VIITKIKSSQGTFVTLEPTIDPNKGKNKGNVENWLLELQSSMRISLKRECKTCIETYPQMKRGDWCFAGYPSQCVLNISQLYWTKECETLMDQKGLQGLKEFDVTQQAQISEIVQIVRGNITKNQRRLMQALCTLDVHAGAVIKDMVSSTTRRGTIAV